MEKENKNRHNGVPIICQDCGKIGYRFDISAKFCLECANKHNQDWYKKKLKRKREGLGINCIFCGKKSEHIHHADKNKSNNDNMNLIPLCSTCHHKAHSLIINPILKRYGKRNSTKNK